MKIEHIAMYVNDLERAKDFFTHYFHVAAGEMYHNKTTGDGYYESCLIDFENNQIEITI